MSRQSAVSVRLAGLERAQRFAGECFGHEELNGIAANSRRHAPLFWALAGIASCVALAVIAFH